MQIDVAKTAAQNLVDLINNANTTTYTVDQLTFGTPTVRTPDADPHNTSLDVSGVPAQGWAGTRTITYTRLGMLDGKATDVTTFTVSLTATPAQVLTQLATSMGLVESEVELSNLVMPPDTSTAGSVTIQATAASKLYVGTQALVLNGAQDLTASITTTQMNGFDAVV